MNKGIINNLLRILFFWLTSFFLASIGYYILWLTMPQHHVFGALFRMYLYHTQHPLEYIAIPCFFYGIIATILSDKFLENKLIGKLFLTFIIILTTLIISSPFGGMLWHYHDMLAGRFPDNWIQLMISNGFSMGLSLGWIIVALSIPYNIFGAIICCFLTNLGSKLFRKN